MYVFEDTFRITVEKPFGEFSLVRFAVRITENRVDEYHLRYTDFLTIAQEFETQDTTESGPIKVKKGSPETSIYITNGMKREIYRLPLPQFQVLIAQFLAEVS